MLYAEGFGHVPSASPLSFCVHGMQGLQSVAGSRYADVEWMSPQAVAVTRWDYHDRVTLAASNSNIDLL
jgi:hypothetical protein